MSTKLKAGTATSGAVIDADATGILELQSGSTPTTAITVDASQNVGIKTTPVTWNTAYPALQIGTTGSFSAPNTAAYLSNNWYSNSSGTGTYITTGTAGIAGWEGNSFAFYNAPSGTAGTATTMTERMRIDSAGNVGIGNTTSSGVRLKVEHPSGTYDVSNPIQRWAYANVPIVDLYMDGSANPISNTDSASTYNQPFAMKWQFRGSDRMALTSGGNLQFNSGYGSVATAYGCRAWVNFNGTGTVAIRASGNVSSITDNGTGDYTVNFTTAMPDTNYSVVGAMGDTGSVATNTSAAIRPKTYATGSIRFVNCIGTAAAVDFDYENIAVFR